VRTGRSNSYAQVELDGHRYTVYVENGSSG
jgi:hypothetical protein